MCAIKKLINIKTVLDLDEDLRLNLDINHWLRLSS